MCVSRFVSICLCVCSTEPSRKLPSLLLMLCGLDRTCPPPSLLPRATFPVPLSLPCSRLSRFCLGFPQERAMRWSWCKKYNLPDAQPGKADQKASPSLRVGLFLYCISPPLVSFNFRLKHELFLPESGAWFCVFIFGNASHTKPAFLHVLAH